MPSRITSSKPVRVLLVDDHHAMLERATAALEPTCEVVGAVNDGVAALAAAQSLNPDVIVLDISMPGMNGLEVAAHLRAAGSPAAVVFLTVHYEEEFVLAARDAGGAGYVVKSRLIADLETAVKTVRAGGLFVSPTR